jgi:hypothetical protein
VSFHMFLHSKFSKKMVLHFPLLWVLRAFVISSSLI